jgi:betaine-aldehyde dehydrogenase
MSPKLPSIEESLPKKKMLFYGGEWHDPKSTELRDTINPGNGSVIDSIPQANAEDVNLAVQAAHIAFQTWRLTPPTQSSRRHPGPRSRTGID